MGLFENLPYTNYHELNLAWVLRDLKAQGLKLKDLEQFIKDLDIPDAVKDILTEWLEDGTLEAIIASMDEPVASQLFFPNLNQVSYYSANFAVLCSYGKTFILDCGAYLNWEACRDLLDALVAVGKVKNIDAIIISHYHYDHVENIANILNRYPHEDCIVYGPLNPAAYFTGSGSDGINTNYALVVNSCNNAGVTFYEVSEDITIHYPANDSYSYFELINSTPADYTYYKQIDTVYNNYSMICTFTVDAQKLMFPGDLQRAGQERVMRLHEIGQVELYSAHHHGIQNDDYIPYLDAITPHYIIVQTSGYRINVSARSSYISNYYNEYTVLLTNAFGPVTFDVYKTSTQLLEGRPLSSMGDSYSYKDIYVDNSATELGDGTEAHPVNSIFTALMLCNNNINMVYRIYIKATGIVYDGVFIRNRTCNIILNAWGVEKPEIDYIYCGFNSDLELRNLKLTGYRTFAGVNAQLIVRNQPVYVYQCDFDMSGLEEGATGIVSEFSTVYAIGNTFTGNGSSGTMIGLRAYRYSTSVSNGNTFTDMLVAYHLGNHKVCLRDADTVSGVGTYLQGATNTGVPVELPSMGSDLLAAITALIATNSASVTSGIFYASGGLKTLQGASIVSLTVS